jgi:hypothetical protein
VAQAYEQMNSQGCKGCDGHGGQGDGCSGGHWNDNGGGCNIGAMGMDHSDGGQGKQFCICVFFSFGLSVCFDNELSGSMCK